LKKEKVPLIEMDLEHQENGIKLSKWSCRTRRVTRTQPIPALFRALIAVEGQHIRLTPLSFEPRGQSRERFNQGYWQECQQSLRLPWFFVVPFLSHGT
jgi:hypothetical protein